MSCSENVSQYRDLENRETTKSCKTRKVSVRREIPKKRKILNSENNVARFPGKHQLNFCRIRFTAISNQFPIISKLRSHNLEIRKWETRNFERSGNCGKPENFGKQENLANREFGKLQIFVENRKSLFDFTESCFASSFFPIFLASLIHSVLQIYIYLN